MTDAHFRGLVAPAHLGLLPDHIYMASLRSANGGTSAVAFPSVCIVTGSVFFAKLHYFTEIITSYKTDLYLRIPREKHLHCSYLKFGRLNPIQTGHARLLPQKNRLKWVRNLK